MATEINTANLTCDALRILIHKLQTELGLPVSKTSKWRKADLVEIADQLQAAEAAWYAQMGLDHDPAEDDANDAAVRAQYAPLHEQPMEDSPAAIARTEEASHVTSWGTDEDEPVIMFNDEIEDDEFVRSVLTDIRELPVTETDVKEAEVDMLVQLGSRLVWGKLISVVNRRTLFCPSFLVTVEVEGIRRLIPADHALAA